VLMPPSESGALAKAWKRARPAGEENSVHCETMHKSTPTSSR